MRSIRILQFLLLPQLDCGAWLKARTNEFLMTMIWIMTICLILMMMILIRVKSLKLFLPPASYSIIPLSTFTTPMSKFVAFSSFFLFSSPPIPPPSPSPSSFLSFCFLHLPFSFLALSPPLLCFPFFLRIASFYLFLPASFYATLPFSIYSSPLPSIPPSRYLPLFSAFPSILSQLLTLLSLSIYSLQGSTSPNILRSSLFPSPCILFLSIINEQKNYQDFDRGRRSNV